MRALVAIARNDIATKGIDLLQDDSVTVLFMDQSKLAAFNFMASRDLADVLDTSNLTRNRIFIEIKIGFIDSSFGKNSREETNNDKRELRYC